MGPGTDNKFLRHTQCESSTNRETPIVFDEFVRFFAALAEVVFVNAAPTVPARARHMFAFLIVATRLAGGPSDPKWGC